LPLHRYTELGIDMLQLIYTSKEAHPMRAYDIAKILSQSRHHNERVQITGYLIYHQGHFLQVIEGNKDAIKALYARIEKDVRHKNVKLIYCLPILARAFENWSMGYVDTTFPHSTTKLPQQGVVDYIQMEVWKGRNVNNKIMNKIIEVIKKFQQGPLDDYSI
jgi:hypothetical protein